MLTQETLKNYLEYDPELGLWRWIRRPRRHPKNKMTKEWFKGTYKLRDGRLQINFLGEHYYAHTLAWLYVHGQLIKGLDHVNRNNGDNRISNLRTATPSQQQMNKGLRADNISGKAGVYYEGSIKLRKRWVGEIKKDGVKYKKRFQTMEEALEWRRETELLLFSEYAPPNLKEEI